MSLHNNKLHNSSIPHNNITVASINIRVKMILNHTFVFSSDINTHVCGTILKLQGKVFIWVHGPKLKHNENASRQNIYCVKGTYNYIWGTMYHHVMYNFLCTCKYCWKGKKKNPINMGCRQMCHFELHSLLQVTDPRTQTLASAYNKMSFNGPVMNYRNRKERSLGI